MADRTKTANELVIECRFLDGDTRTITLRNPRSNVSATEIQNLETFMQTENIIIGDRAESDFLKINKAVKRETTTTYLDLS